MASNWHIRPDWLNLVSEYPVEPDLPIIDSHHHLWKLPRETYLQDEFLGDFGGHNIIASIYAECGAMYRRDGPAHLRSVGEIEFANGIAAQSANGLYGDTRLCAAIIGYADLDLGVVVGETLDAHLSRAPDRYRGIRCWVARDPDGALEPMRGAAPGRMASSAFRQGVREVARRGLTVDLWIFHHQLPELTALARAEPEVTIILDHLATPLGVGAHANRKDEIFGRWRADLAELALCPNVRVKLGGLTMQFTGFGWHDRRRPPASDELVAALADYYHAAIDLFGPARCMFESNFPVDKRACSYGVLWNAHKKIAARYSSGEKTMMMCGTAARTYRIALPEAAAPA